MILCHQFVQIAHGLLSNSLVIVLLMIPIHNVKFFKRIVWSSVSNAFDKSRNILMGNWLLSKCVVILSTISRATYSVEWWGLNPYWLSDSSLVLVKYMSNWLFIILSKTFEITGKRDIGL